MKELLHNKEIIIDLDNVKSDGCILFDEKEIIHQEQLRDVRQLLIDRIESVKYYNPQRADENQYKNDAISVFARRGAGKSTFVKTIVELIRNNSGSFSDLGKDLFCLDVLELNQIQQKEILMIRLLAQIEESFQYEIDNRNLDKESLASYKKAKEKLYEALPVIEGIGSTSLYPDWDDSAYLADRYMNLASNVKDLEKRFHKYIQSGLDLLKKKALLFVLDDSDVDIPRSFEILELIRLYFTSPQIILMLTGDAALYGMIVRRNYWRYFDGDFLDKECKSSNKKIDKYDEYRQMVYRLESQYLQKMIKPTHRIILNNLYDKLQVNKQLKIKVSFCINGEKQLIDIKEFYANLFNCFDLGKESIRTTDTYISHLLSQPIRNQIRLLGVYALHLKTGSNDTKRLTTEILKVFEVYINQYSSDSKFLMAHTPNYPIWLLKFLVENSILEIGSGLLPKTEDDNLNNAIIPLGLSCIEQMNENASMIFDYWIRISFTKRIMQLLGKDEERKDFISHVSLYSNSNISKILGNMIAYCYPKFNPIRDFENSKQKNIPGTKKFSKCYSVNNCSIESRFIHLLQLETIGSNNNETNFFSIYRPLAVLSEILKLFNNDIEEKKLKEILLYVFIRSCQIKSYIEPERNISYQANRAEGVNIDKYISKNDENNYDTFKEELMLWCKKCHCFRVAPHFIDRIFSRYYYTMLNWNNDTQSKKELLGDAISIQVVALWNSAIVETMIMLDKLEEIILDYPVNINLAFLTNYDIFIKTDFLKDCKRESLWVSWLLECPVLKKYISPFITSLQEDLSINKIQRSEVYKILSYEGWQKLSNELKIVTEENKNAEEELSKVLNYRDLKDKISDVEYMIELYQEYISDKNKTFDERKQQIKELKEFKKKKRRLEKRAYSLGITHQDDEETNIYIAEFQDDINKNKEHIRRIQKEMEEYNLNTNELAEYKSYYALKDRYSIYNILNLLHKQQQ